MSAAAADPLAGAEILVGHRELLETFHELARDLEDAGPDAALETARGAVAFLRHAVLPFGRHEEALLGGAPPLREDAAFEHAFVAAEVDALAAAAASLAAAPRPARPAALAALRRRVHRVEAALEMHVAKAEDRGLFAAAPADALDVLPAAPRPPVRPAGSSGPRALDEREVRAFLAAGEWGVLSTLPAGGGAPYAVPVGYGWDGRALFFASGPGRKAEHLGANPLACLTVADVADGDRWRCVVASGPVQPVRGMVARARAAAHLARHRGAPRPADLARLARAQLFRLDPTELTGRARG